MKGTKRSSPKQRRSRPRGQVASHVETGSLELTSLTTGTPSGTFVGGQIPLIPTFQPTSRLGVISLQYSQFEIVLSRVTYTTYTTVNVGGRIALAYTYNTVDPSPVNNSQIIQVARSKSGTLWKNLTVTSNGRQAEKRRFATIPADQYIALDAQDKQIYTPFTLIFGTDLSPQSGTKIGSLIWHYKIRFFNPNVLTGVPNADTILTMIEPSSDDDSE